MWQAGCLIVIVAIILAFVKAAAVLALATLILPISFTAFNVFIVWAMFVVGSISFKGEFNGK